jgi:hypothetical protein
MCKRAVAQLGFETTADFRPVFTSLAIDGQPVGPQCSSKRILAGSRTSERPGAVRTNRTSAKRRSARDVRGAGHADGPGA